MTHSSTDETNEETSKRTGKSKRRRRILKYTFGVIGSLLVVIMVAGGIEYYRLQPAHYFAKVPVISQPGNSSLAATSSPTSTNAAGTASGTENATQSNQAQGTGNGAQNSSNLTPVASSQGLVGSAPGTFNVLLLGSDERTSGTPGHSDSIILVHVNLSQHQYNVLSIPRDSRIYLKGFGYTKLTSVMYVEQAKYGITTGTQYALDAISNLTGLPINYYAETNYWGLRNIVNAIGGITMNIPFNMTLTHPWYPKDYGKKFTPGSYTLDGKMVTEVVHERYSLPNGDYGRQQLQESALVGIAKKILNNITLAPKALRVMHSYLIATNISPEDMVSLALAIRNFHSSQIHYYQALGKSVLIYNDVLQAQDDEILLNTSKLKQIVEQHFG